MLGALFPKPERKRAALSGSSRASVERTRLFLNKKTLVKRFLLLFSLTISFSGCKTASQSSGLKHDLNTPVETSARLGWATQPYDEFLQEIGIRSEAEKDSVYPDSTPMSSRLQYWVDAIDSELRSEDKTGMFVHIPKPKVRLTNFPQQNAFVKVARLQFENVKFSLSDEDPLDFAANDYVVAYLNGNYPYEKREGKA